MSIDPHDQVSFPKTLPFDLTSHSSRLKISSASSISLVMKTITNYSRATLSTLILFVVAACTSPSMVRLGGVSYVDRAASRVELGGLGIRADSGPGFHHLASIDECGINVPIAIDFVVREFPAAISGFDPPKLKAIAQRYARSRASLQKSSLISVSLRESDLESWFNRAPSAQCTELIRRNLEQVRFINAVVVLVTHSSLTAPDAHLAQLEATLGPRGHIIFRHPGNPEPLFTTGATDTIAYQSAHLCWSEPTGDTLTVRIDDPRFSVCPIGYTETAPEGWQPPDASTASPISDPAEPTMPKRPDEPQTSAPNSRTQTSL